MNTSRSCALLLIVVVALTTWPGRTAAAPPGVPAGSGGGPTSGPPGRGGGVGPGENASAAAKAVHAAIARLQAQRQDYLARRAQLVARLATAAPAERGAIHAQLQVESQVREREERAFARQIREELRVLREGNTSNGP